MIWGFKSVKSFLWWTGLFAAHQSRTRAEPENQSPVWQSLQLLQNMGLLSFVPHIFENNSDAAEPVHPYGIGQTGEPPIEQEIGHAADRAARTMALPSKLEEAEDDGFLHFCPILHTRPSAQMIGVARLTYRPRTRRTAAWFAEIQESGPIWIDAFNKLSEKGTVAGLRRALNYA